MVESGTGGQPRPLDDADFRWVLTEHERFWDGRDLRGLHHPLFVHEFASHAFAVDDSGGQPCAYLLGTYVSEHRRGYIHLVAVRQDRRGQGLARRLYEHFAEHARLAGADHLKAITTPGNTASIAFHRQLGFTTEVIPEYAGPDSDRVVMTSIV